jgi:hypothetical protein
LRSLHRTPLNCFVHLGRIDRTRASLDSTSKFHLLFDRQGIPLAGLLPPQHAHDSKLLEPKLKTSARRMPRPKPTARFSKFDPVRGCSSTYLVGTSTEGSLERSPS